MKQENTYNLKVGDTVEFINRVGCPVKLKITRIDEKSVYSPNRESWNTVNAYIKKYNAKISNSR